MPTIPEIRAARALLGWTQQDLAIRLGVALLTVKRIELGETPLINYLSKIEKIFADEGVTFLSSKGNAEGISR